MQGRVPSPAVQAEDQLQLGERGLPIRTRASGPFRSVQI